MRISKTEGILNLTGNKFFCFFATARRLSLLSLTKIERRKFITLSDRLCLQHVHRGAERRAVPLRRLQICFCLTVLWRCRRPAVVVLYRAWNTIGIKMWNFPWRLYGIPCEMPYGIFRTTWENVWNSTENFTCFSHGILWDNGIPGPLFCRIAPIFFWSYSGCTMSP